MPSVESRKDSSMEHWLIDAARGGSTQALETLFDVHVLPVYRYALGALLDVTAAERVTDAVFRTVSQRLGEYQPRKMPFVSWLMRTARAEVRRVGPRVEPDPPAGTPDLRSLPVDQVEVLLLRFAAGLSVPETAAVLDVPERRVRSLQHQAIRATAEAVRAVRQHDPLGEHKAAVRAGVGA